jgi:hypothetical protein
MNKKEIINKKSEIQIFFILYSTNNKYKDHNHLHKLILFQIYNHYRQDNLKNLHNQKFTKVNCKNTRNLKFTKAKFKGSSYYLEIIFIQVIRCKIPIKYWIVFYLDLLTVSEFFILYYIYT